MKNNKAQPLEFFYNVGRSTIEALETPGGILASSREEIFGCIFGRDSLITSLKLLRAYRLDPDPYYLKLVKKILKGLVGLQGQETNIESGEEPGKCIHEFRTTGHEHLTKEKIPPWYAYPDGTMRNFDSVDSTPLFLIAFYRYFQKSGDKDFILSNLESIRLSLYWIFDFGDNNRDGLIDYQKHPERKSGGLIIQNWMDSTEAAFHEDETALLFPIAPIEAQAYAFLALKLWADYFATSDSDFSLKLLEKAEKLKELINEKFIFGNASEFIIAHALDGDGKPLVSMRSSVGHILWSCLNPDDDGKFDCVLEENYIPFLVKRLMQPDIFEPRAGIRTLSTASRAFDPMSYHNGSIWPHDNSLIAEGMEKLGYTDEADRIRQAVFMAYEHFRTPVELFAFHEGKYLQYQSAGGQIACSQQAWSAATMISDALALKGKV